MLFPVVALNANGLNVNSMLHVGSTARSRNGAPVPEEGGGGQDDGDEDEDAIPEDLPDEEDINDPQRFVALELRYVMCLMAIRVPLHVAVWLL